MGGCTMNGRGFPKGLLLSSIFLSVGLMAACGGGGGGTTTQIEPSQDLQGTYTGAATKGDFATFTVSGTTLSYTLEGGIFGKKSGSINIEPLAEGAGPDTHFWKSEDGTAKIFLSGNIGLAYVSNIDGTRDAIIIGLKDVENIANIIGKTFVYVDLRTNGVDVCEIKIYGTSNDTSGTFDYTCLVGGSGTGCWNLDSQRNRLAVTTNLLDPNSCANWDGSNPTAYVVAKPGNNRAGFIVDYTDGSGVGIGLEKKSYSTELDENKTYTFETLSTNGEICPATVTVSFNRDISAWRYTWSSPGCNFESAGTLYIDQTCNNTPYDGIICAQNDRGTQYYVMFDPIDGYYMAINTEGNYVEIGALK